MSAVSTLPAGGLVLPRFEHPGMSVAAEVVGDELRVRFSGNADMNVVEPLDGYLGAIHTEALTRGLVAVKVDFRKLEFMNSSCFKCFVSWLGRVHDLPPGDRYRIAFGSNRDLHWQRRSLNALRCFALEVVTIEP